MSPHSFSIIHKSQEVLTAWNTPVPCLQREVGPRALICNQGLHATAWCAKGERMNSGGDKKADSHRNCFNQRSCRDAAEDDGRDKTRTAGEEEWRTETTPSWFHWSIHKEWELFPNFMPNILVADDSITHLSALISGMFWHRCCKIAGSKWGRTNVNLRISNF